MNCLSSIFLCQRGVEDHLREGKMNRNGLKLLGVLVSAAIAVLFWVGVSGAQDDWPREIATQEGKITVYQPQLESFKGDKVNARAALSILKKDSPSLSGSNLRSIR